MLINYILRNKIDYKDIEDVTSFGLLLFAIYSCYNIYFDGDLSTNRVILKYYMLVEICFLPFNKKDVILHHLITILFCKYYDFYGILDNKWNYAFVHVLKTEVSSIFLCLNHFSNKYNKIKIIKMLSNLCFFATFFKCRIYDYYNNVINNGHFYELLKTTDDVGQKIFTYGSTYIFYGLNLYWFSLMLKFLYKSLKLNYTYYNLETNLKYSYFVCWITTILSYIFLATPDQRQIYSGPIFTDVMSNGLLATSSYEFHNYIQQKFKDNTDFDMADTTFKKYLLQDILAIHFRLYSQVSCYLTMHNIYDDYQNILNGLVISSVVTIWIINCIFDYCINNNIILLYSNKTHILNKSLDFFFGINPFIGIALSTLDSSKVNSNMIYLLLYVISLITFIKPFYVMNHFMIHFTFIFVNYALVLNNVNV